MTTLTIRIEKGATVGEIMNSMDALDRYEDKKMFGGPEIDRGITNLVRSLALELSSNKLGDEK